MSDVEAWIAGAAFIVSVVSFAFALRTWNLERRPFLSIRIMEQGQLHPIPDAPGGVPMFFEIQNSGRGPAIVTAISRRWIGSPVDKDPAALDKFKKPDGGFLKFTHIPISPSFRSTPIRTLVDDPKTGLLDGDWLYFQGCIWYKDIADKYYAIGFLFVFRRDLPALGLHQALPGKDFDCYNYEVGPICKWEYDAMRA